MILYESGFLYLYRTTSGLVKYLLYLVICQLFLLHETVIFIFLNAILCQFHHNENMEPNDICVRKLALYALKTQELNQLSDRATDQVLESTSDLLQQNEQNLKKRVRVCLEKNGMNVREIDGLEDVLESPPSTVEGIKQLKTPAQRNKYFKNKLHMVVSQCPVPNIHQNNILGNVWKLVG